MTWPRRIAWLLVFLGLALFVAWGVRLSLLGRTLLVHIAQAQELAAAPERADIETACRLVSEMRGDVLAVHREAGLLAQLGPLLGWVPRIGGDLEAAPHLLSVADGLSEAGTHLCTVAQAATNESAADVPPLERYVNLVMEHQEPIAQAAAAVDRAQYAWDQVDIERLSPTIGEKLALLEEGLPLLHAGLVLFQEAPELLGFHGPRTYLILAQNEYELRPTGGFISGAGRLTVDDGQIVALTFMDATWADDYLNKPYPAPPGPLFHYMKSEIWLLRDANWSPDFPTSANQAAYFYEYGQGVHVDGVIAVDQRALELLLQGLDEIYVPDLTEPVTAANVRQYLLEAWEPGETGVTSQWIFSRKEFMGRFATAIRERVERDPGSVDWMESLRALNQALTTRHLQIVVDNPAVANELALLGWDGALRQTDGDYLLVVDANLGFDKANALISQTLDYRVTLNTHGTAGARLAVTYIHHGDWPGQTCRQGQHFYQGVTYEALMHNCYYNYMRLYLPAGSALMTATAHPTPGEYLLGGEPDSGEAISLGEEAGKSVFAQFFVVEYGKTLTTTFAYNLPRVVEGAAGERYRRYTLLIQKQPGTGDVPVSFELTLPPGARLLNARPAPYAVEGTNLAFKLLLTTDIQVLVRYTP